MVIIIATYRCGGDGEGHPSSYWRLRNDRIGVFHGGKDDKKYHRTNSNIL